MASDWQSNSSVSRSVKYRRESETSLSSVWANVKGIFHVKFIVRMFSCWLGSVSFRYKLRILEFPIGRVAVDWFHLLESFERNFISFFESRCDFNCSLKVIKFSAQTLIYSLSVRRIKNFSDWVSWREWRETERIRDLDKGRVEGRKTLEEKELKEHKNQLVLKLLRVRRFQIHDNFIIFILVAKAFKEPSRKSYEKLKFSTLLLL